MANDQPSKLEVLYFEGCPNWQIAAGRLETVAAEMGLRVERRDVTGDKGMAGFAGSPTILRGGRDLFPGAPLTKELSCRMYETPQGRAGSPSIDQLRAALAGERG